MVVSSAPCSSHHTVWPREIYVRTRVYAIECLSEVRRPMTTRAADQAMTSYQAVPGEHRTERFDLRVTPSEAAFIRQAAASRRQSVTEFLTNGAVQAAAQAVEEDRRIVLMNEVFDRLAEEMEGSDEVVPALANLVRRPRRFKLPEESSPDKS